MDKKIITVVTVVLALVFSLILVLLFNIVTDRGNRSTDDFSNVIEAVDYEEMKRYDGATLNGDQVVSTINTLRASKSGVRMRHLVYNGKSYCMYGFAKASSTDSNVYATESAGLSSMTSNSPKAIWVGYTGTETVDLGTNGINRTSIFESRLVTNDNNTIVGIYFKKKG